ncbi:GNAT family N-acetyltransferase [Lactobacillus johnsonii]|jgi:ribosomal protein S18 acetylase RimI-like enzyme|uniref:GNAT family N-acetyltransferase n=1 Tax=Lactobacillus johnsonii TaxID=33959 RepID=A0A9W4E7X3_LACJH|nr:GNAT family N-acetyltransferase [Lactobacillus johnsonii]AOG26657.1 GNAT family N-acetyltransferase [Lactobacillus johnsonii]AZZ66810.1 GNAT family N-acetyltransferase [Lactobacillus johnsonii]MCI6230544.1 GNAT family N-acetyltransferase [Lactobacillus johnsonii]MCI6882794.1 GNAT family N-acetyltransferase [Lactobacillus johnsonii]MCI7591428.1 GNAT family N-acetyltransferase [Lactobacillus johnsonii]
MTLNIRTVKMDDLDAIVELESSAFHMSEEMTRKDMIGRIENYPDTFLVAQVDGKVVGHVFGPVSKERYIKDELYFKNQPNNAQYHYQTILSLATNQEYRKQGIASALIEELCKIAQSQDRRAITLTCLPKLFHFYEKRGFINEGKTSDDIPDPDDVSSYNMVRALKI